MGGRQPKGHKAAVPNQSPSQTGRVPKVSRSHYLPQPIECTGSYLLVAITPIMIDLTCDTFRSLKRVRLADLLVRGRDEGSCALIPAVDLEVSRMCAP